MNFWKHFILHPFQLSSYPGWANYLFFLLVRITCTWGAGDYLDYVERGILKKEVHLPTSSFIPTPLRLTTFNLFYIYFFHINPMMPNYNFIHLFLNLLDWIKKYIMTWFSTANPPPLCEFNTFYILSSLNLCKWFLLYLLLFLGKLCNCKWHAHCLNFLMYVCILTALLWPLLSTLSTSNGLSTILLFLYYQGIFLRL